MEKTFVVYEMTAQEKSNAAIFNGITEFIVECPQELGDFDTFAEAEAYAKNFSGYAEIREEHGIDYLFVNEVYVGIKTFDEDGEIDNIEMILIRGCFQ